MCIRTWCPANMRRIRNRFAILRLAFVGLVLAACEDSTAPATGEISVVLTGSPVSTGELRVIVSGGSDSLLAPVGPGAPTRLPNLAAGRYAVQLVGLPEDCSAADNPRTITVSGGAFVVVVFAVTCPTTLRIMSSMTGLDLDDDGYSVTVSGTNGIQIATVHVPANGFALVRDNRLGTGTVLLAVEDLASNCTAGDGNRFPAFVAAGRTSDVTLQVQCVAGYGNLHVTTRTVGSPADADGYVIVVDGAARGVVGAIDSTVLFELRVGTRAVSLAGVAANCSAGPPLQQTTVDLEQPGLARFTVECVPGKTDTLTVTTLTAGDNIDPDGYTLMLTSPFGYSDAALPLPVNGTASFTDLDANRYEATLVGVAANCSTPPAQSFSFPESKQLEFAITCATGSGGVRVTTRTSGADVDADGYFIVVDGEPGRRIGISDVVTVTGLPAGTHDVWLSDVASNCAFIVTSRHRFAIADGSTADVSFNLQCHAFPGPLQITISTTGADIDADGYVLQFIDADYTYYQWTERAPVNGTISVPLYNGNFYVTLTGIASNCTSADPGPRALYFPAQTRLAFTVVCTASAAPREASAAGPAPETAAGAAREGVSNPPARSRSSGR